MYARMSISPLWLLTFAETFPEESSGQPLVNIHPWMHILLGMSTSPPAALPVQGRRIIPKAGAISSYCAAANISRDELARRMGVSCTTAYRVDSGRTDPSPSFIAALMDVTGLEFDHLFEVTRSAA